MANRRTSSRVTLESLQIPWILLGTIADDAEDGDPLDATGRLYSTPLVSSAAATGVLKWVVPYGINHLELMGGFAANDGTGEFDLYAARGPDDGTAEDCDNLFRICTVTPVGGAQRLDGDGIYLWDELTITNNLWGATVQAVVPGTGYAAHLRVDLLGYAKILIHAHDANTALTSALTIYASGA